MDRQLYEGQEGHHECRRPGRTPPRGHHGSPPGLPYLASPLRDLHFAASGLKTRRSDLRRRPHAGWEYGSILLTLADNRRYRIGRARQAEARLRRIINTYGVPPAAAHNLQMAIIQGLCFMPPSSPGAETGEWRESTRGPSTRWVGPPRELFDRHPGPGDSRSRELMPARALLNHRQARFAQCLFARPADGQGPEEILTREGAAVAARIRAAAATRPGDSVERQEWSRRRAFPGQMIVGDKDEAFAVAKDWRRRDTFWTDGSRLDDGGVGAAVAWRAREGWDGRRYYLGSNKEVFDAEVFAIYRALQLIGQKAANGRQFTIFVDSAAACRELRRMWRAPDSASPWPASRPAPGLWRGAMRLRFGGSRPIGGRRAMRRRTSSRRQRPGTSSRRTVSAMRTGGRQACRTWAESLPRSTPARPGSGLGTASALSGSTGRPPGGPATKAAPPRPQVSGRALLLASL